MEDFEKDRLVLSDEEVMALAVEAMLCKNLAQLRTEIYSNGSPSSLLAYPRLVKATLTMIRTNHPNKADAYIVLAFLYRAEKDYSQSAQHFTKAIKIRPKVWRL